MQVFVTSLGCKLNLAESDEMARGFVAAGHRLVDRLEEADLHVVNTCHVTAEAARDSRRAARRGAALARGPRTVLTGCWSTAEAAAARGLPGVALVVANDHKDRLVEQVHEALGLAPAAMPLSEAPQPASLLAAGHARAHVKVEDGCDMGCAFCVIPSTRGGARSRPLATIVAEVQELVAAGYPEIVVTGVQISDWRDGRRRLVDLVAALLGETAVPRLRLSSIAPWRFDSRLLPLFADRRLCRHLHLALQSGSTSVLRRMRRPYRAESFAALVDRVRIAVPGVAITTDVLAGFPGETDDEHRESLAFVERQGFARVHVFPFSPRPETPAADLADPVDPHRRAARVAELRAVATESERRFAAAQLGTTAEVVWETRRAGRWRGLTDHYVRVVTDAEAPLRRRITATRLVGVEGEGLRGEVVDGGRESQGVPLNARSDTAPSPRPGR